LIIKTLKTCDGFKKTPGREAKVAETQRAQSF